MHFSGLCTVTVTQASSPLRERAANSTELHGIFRIVLAVRYGTIREKNSNKETKRPTEAYSILITLDVTFFSLAFVASVLSVTTWGLGHAILDFCNKEFVNDTLLCDFCSVPETKGEHA